MCLWVQLVEISSPHPSGEGRGKGVAGCSIPAHIPWVRGGAESGMFMVEVVDELKINRGDS